MYVCLRRLHPATSDQLAPKLQKGRKIIMNKLERAKNPSTDEDTLAALAKDEDWYERSTVARNPNTSALSERRHRRRAAERCRKDEAKGNK